MSLPDTDTVPRPRGQSITAHIAVIKALHLFGPALTCGGLAADPWPNQPAVRVLGLRDTGELTTPVIRPEAWFPLINAAWTYIDKFGPDILRARATWHRLLRDARLLQGEDYDAALDRWLADADHRIPVHTHYTGADRAGKVHWSLLTAFIGANNNRFDRHSASGRRRRTLIEREATLGRTQSGIITDLRQVQRPDGNVGPWHPDLQPLQMRLESVALRNACYIFVTALSMMRDNEKRA